MAIKNSLLGWRLYRYISRIKNGQVSGSWVAIGWSKSNFSVDGNSKWDVQTEDNANLINKLWCTICNSVFSEEKTEKHSTSISATLGL